MTYYDLAMLRGMVEQLGVNKRYGRFFLAACETDY